MYAAPNIEDDEDLEQRPAHDDTMAGLFASDKPKPKRKRKSRAKQRPENQISNGLKTGVAHTSGKSVDCVPKPAHGPPASNLGPKPPSTGSGKQITPQNRRPSAKSTKEFKHRVSPAAPPIAKPSKQVQDKKKTKRRCRKRDPAEQPSQPWTEEEIAQFRALVKAEGATAWKDKSAKLARLCGNVRTPKALHTRYLREIGRIVDRPRCA